MFIAIWSFPKVFPSAGDKQRTDITAKIEIISRTSLKHCAVRLIHRNPRHCFLTGFREILFFQPQVPCRIKEFFLFFFCEARQCFVSPLNEFVSVCRRTKDETSGPAGLDQCDKFVIAFSLDKFEVGTDFVFTFVCHMVSS